MRKWLARLGRETQGQDLIEYALLGATIAIGIILAMQGVRGSLQTGFDAISIALGPGS
jgi:Flp pilus assembly pilin Flp